MDQDLLKVEIWCRQPGHWKRNDLSVGTVLVLSLVLRLLLEVVVGAEVASITARGHHVNPKWCANKTRAQKDRQGQNAPCA